MVKAVISWARGWITTIDIRLNDPELYRELTRPADPADFTEAGPPAERH